MAAEFHRKTAALFEEFKKRELHFLKTEVNLNSNINWKSNISAPLQEYMQKINKREQETEKTYKDLMRQMEELGQRTDQMSLKLEKLNALRNVALSSNIPTWPSNADTYDRPLQSYYSDALLQTAPKMLSFSTPISDFHSRIQPDISSINNSYQLSMSKPNYDSVTTQTEYIFCDNCHFPLILNSEIPVSIANPTSRSTPKTITKENYQHPYHDPGRSQETIALSKETEITKSVAKNHYIVPNTNYNFSEPLVNDHNVSMLRNESVSSGIGSNRLKGQELINEQVERKMSMIGVDNAVIGVLRNEPFQQSMPDSYTRNVVTDGLTKKPFQQSMPDSYTKNVVTDGLTKEPFQQSMPDSYTKNVVTDRLTNEPFQQSMPGSCTENVVTDGLTNEPFQQSMPDSYTKNGVTDGLTNQFVQKRMSKSYTDSVVTSELTNIPVQKRLSESYTDNVVSDIPTNIPVQKRISESYTDNTIAGDYVTHTEEKHYVEIEDNDLLSNDGNFEQTVSKSDDESMSHEFNFLDSDKDKNSRRQSLHQMAGDNTDQLTDSVIHNERYENTHLEGNYSMQSNPNSLLKVQQTSESRGDIDVTRKDLSGPPSPPVHSENASVGSESDSFSEKETPLTKTAAYQAMLSNVGVAKPQQRSAPISDSDSEDEIENALANAVRRTSHIAFDTAISESKAEKRKESIADIKAEKNTKSVVPVSTNKPQNKLSKNTRKVLGLDTSSGSEVELEVKSPTSKIEEESDEFDFYD